MLKKILLLSLTVAVFPGAKAQDAPVMKFTEVSASLGLKDVPNGGHVAWGDYNNDGYLDFVLGGRQLFRNGGPPDWKFVDVTAEAGIKCEGGGGLWLDYDNDGNLDLLSFGQKEALWRNSGKPNYKFNNATAGAISDDYHTLGVVPIDYDRDSYVDLYVVNYSRDQDYLPDRFLQNVRGIFRDATAKCGLNAETKTPLPGRSAVAGDYNNDGLPDIYVSNYRLKPNYLWELQKGNLFKDVAADRGVIGIQRQGYYGHTIASAFGDLNNDGLLDLVAGNFAHKDTVTGRGFICDDAKIYLNQGPDKKYAFEDVREKAGIPIKALDTGDETICGVMLADFDNDGFLDLYVTQTYDELDYAYSWLYRSTGGKNVHFDDVAVDAGVRVWDTYICTAVDYDNDGDLDLVTSGKCVPDKGAPNLMRFFRNDSQQKNWLQVKLKSNHCNKCGIGARVTIICGKEIQIREIGVTMGTTSYSPYIACFGLGETKQIDKLEVRWPCGKVQKVDKPAINKILLVEEK